ncbi:MAG: hypothetical protein QXX95_00165 [Nitrososphaerales archaeon]
MAKISKENKWDRAQRALSNNCIKLHLFKPSQIEIWTVIGREGDEVVDDELNYCSCKDFYFSVLSGKEKQCYHLMALKMAKEGKRFDLIEFDDSELKGFIKALLDELNIKALQFKRYK